MSDFRRRVRIVNQPRICRRPPPPLPCIPPPIADFHLFCYAAWIEPGTPGEANASGTFTLFPDEIQNLWKGSSNEFALGLYVEVEYDPDAQTANVDLFLVEAGAKTDSYFFYDLPCQVEPPIHIPFTRRDLPGDRGHVEIEIGSTPPARRLSQGWSSPYT